MSELRVVTEDLPDYRFPYSSLSPGSVGGYTLVQARANNKWQPRWCIVDMDGLILAVVEADSFDGLSVEKVTLKAYEYIQSLHGLGEEETGIPAQVAEIVDESGAYPESHSFELL